MIIINEANATYENKFNEISTPSCEVDAASCGGGN